MIIIQKPRHARERQKAKLIVVVGFVVSSATVFVFPDNPVPTLVSGFVTNLVWLFRT